MRGIMESDPDAVFCFWGGDRMVEVGGVENLGLHYRESSFFGIRQVVMNLPRIMGQFKLCKSQIETFQPDAVILIDYAGFNLRIAKFAKQRGFKSFFYIAPKVWAWDEGRVKRIRRYVDELFVIFPFEGDYFRGHNIESHFEGNPLVDAIAERMQHIPPRSEFFESVGLEDRPTIALLAGSRSGEIRANLPLMARVARSLPHYQFIVAGVDWLPRKLYEEAIGEGDIRYVEGVTYELLHHSEAAIVCSGTATLETALIGTPQVVMFRLPWIQEVLKPYVLKIPFVSLVNINLGREAVREVIQSSLDDREITHSLSEILVGGDQRERLLADYAELREIIGTAGASRRFAKRMVEILRR